MSNTYKRPDADYNTKTSSKHANRFQEQAINKTALKGEVLDDEFNATIDSLNDLDKRVAKLQVGLFPGSNDPANADNIIYCDGAKARFGKVTANLMANNSVGTDQLQFQSVTNDKMALDSISNAEIMNNAITTPKIVDDAVTEAKIKDDAVTEAKIKDDAVTVNKLKNASVYGHKIAPNSISNYHLTKKTITASKLDLSSFTIVGEIRYLHNNIVMNNSYANIGWLDIAHSQSDYYAKYKNLYKKDKWPEAINLDDLNGYYIFDRFIGIYNMIVTPAQFVLFAKDPSFVNSGLSNYVTNTSGVNNIPNCFGESSITIGLNNMPAHSHAVVNNTTNRFGQKVNSIGVTSIGPGAQDHAVASKRLGENAGSNEFNLATNNTGGSTPLQWLPPTIPIYAMIYMGQPAY